MTVVPGLDHAPGENVVPHVQIRHFSHKALRGLQTPEMFVRVLPQEDAAIGTDRVPGFVDLVGAAFPIDPKGSEAGARFPSQAEVGAESGERRQVKEGAIAAEIEGDSSIFFSPHVQLIVVGGAVGEENNLPLLWQLSGHTHAEREGLQGHFLLRDQGHEAEVRLIGKDQDLVRQTHWPTQAHRVRSAAGHMLHHFRTNNDQFQDICFAQVSV